jgi:hypothetical protein
MDSIYIQLSLLLLIDRQCIHFSGIFAKEQKPQIPTSELITTSQNFIWHCGEPARIDVGFLDYLILL